MRAGVARFALAVRGRVVSETPSPAQCDRERVSLRAEREHATMYQPDSNAHLRATPVSADSTDYAPDTLPANGEDEADSLSNTVFVPASTPAALPSLHLHKDAPLYRPGH